MGKMMDWTTYTNGKCDQCGREREDCENLEIGHYQSIHRTPAGYRWGWMDCPKDMPFWMD